MKRQARRPLLAIVPVVRIKGAAALLLLLLTVLPAFAFLADVPASPTSNRLLSWNLHLSLNLLKDDDHDDEGLSKTQKQQPSVIVAGKIIVDEYGDPTKDKIKNNTSPSTTVGGGGPQAAVGAALALAALALKKNPEGASSSHFPPRQPVKLLAPWYAVNNSFGDTGAAGLWGQLPTVQDYLAVIRQQQDQQTEKSEKSNHSPKPILFIIVEGGKEAPGKNGDSSPLLNPGLRQEISFLGVEPILFPNDEGVFSEQDASHCASLIQQVLNAAPSGIIEGPSVVVSPDMAAFLALQGCSVPPQSQKLDSWAVRNGPKGCQIHCQKNDDSNTTTIQQFPAATLIPLELEILLVLHTRP
ncbi:expressed unknown protein [Seminavis robusta]|uniref:Uncharacterized protein n=1 Tax=Seminavis robusta TaxID=568900 RepID=A0A9N8H849_9STRA|nr:expressed unknown protein [Seminavis robusta]|eukprot:Sro149_g068390.1 n/a (356) ;mRNA; f:31991-33208